MGFLHRAGRLRALVPAVARRQYPSILPRFHSAAYASESEFCTRFHVVRRFVNKFPRYSTFNRESPLGLPIFGRREYNVAPCSAVSWKSAAGYAPGVKMDVLLLKRTFANAVAVPPQMQGRVKVNFYLSSPGYIPEPYVRPPVPLPFWQRWFTQQGWQKRKENMVDKLKTAYTLAKLRHKNKGYSKTKFYEEATELYDQVNKAIAEGNRSTLRRLVTEKLFSLMKNELKHRETSWEKVHWEMVGPIKEMVTVKARLIGLEEKNLDNAFVQVTVRIISNQIFAAYDKHGKQVAGGKDKEILVEDFWVFERHLTASDSKWRLCGRLSL